MENKKSFTEVVKCFLSCLNFELNSENRYRQKGSLKFLPCFKIQHTKYRKSVKLAMPRQEKYLALSGIPSPPAQNRPGPVCPAYLVQAPLPPPPPHFISSNAIHTL